MTAADWTAAATVALVVCAFLQAIVLILQWKTLKKQAAFQEDEQRRQRVRATQRARVLAILARRSLLEAHQTLDRSSGNMEATPMDTFREMAARLATVEAQLLDVDDYLTEAAGAQNKEMDESLAAFLRMAAAVNRLSLGSESPDALTTFPLRKAAAQDAREDSRRAVVRLEKAIGLPANHTLSPAV